MKASKREEDISYEDEPPAEKGLLQMLWVTGTQWL